MSGVLFKWHTHNLQQSLQQMFQSETMVDVTLAVEGQLLKAHRVVLCACSKYFSSMLSSCTNYNPIICMRDVKADEMKALLNFMYMGEATVSRELLAGVLKTAEALQITGLTSTSSEEPHLYLRVDEVSQCDENDFVTLMIGSQVTDKGNEAISVENMEVHSSDGTLSEAVCLDSIDCAVEKSLTSLGSECFLLSGSLATASPTSKLADTLLVSAAPESAIIISTSKEKKEKKERHNTRPPARQYTKEDMKQALEQIRAGKMGIKPAARAYNIPVATLHNTTRRFNISSPMQQGANHGVLHARHAKQLAAVKRETSTAP